MNEPCVHWEFPENVNTVVNTPHARAQPITRPAD